MNTLLIALGVFGLLGALTVSFLFFRGIRFLKSLSGVSPLPSALSLPKITLIAAARNEERHIERATLSLLKQDYPNLEVLIVNDRSTDRTGAILEKLQKQEPRLKVKTIRELPAGWLGKCYALSEGAREALGEWILFTDADVIFDPTALRRAMAHIELEHLDHLAVIPDNRMPGLVLPAFVVHFAISFSLLTRIWKIRDPKSPEHVGIGAFNLVRAALYRKAGGHEKIRLRPDDDLKLGKIIKQAGGSQDVLLGDEFVVVEWYASVWELVRGLEKNSFAGVDYRWSLVIAGTVAQLLTFSWPWLGIWIGPPVARLFCLGAAVLMAIVYGVQAAKLRTPRASAIFFPFMALLFMAIAWRAVLLTVARGGIEWRGTRYSLDQLKANKV